MVDGITINLIQLQNSITLILSEDAEEKDENKNKLNTCPDSKV